MEDITNVDKHKKENVWEDSGIKNLSEYYGLNQQSNTLLLTDVFENIPTIAPKYLNLILFTFFFF